MRSKDLSPKLRISTSETEMIDNTFQLSIGQQIGGLSMFSTAFKRGYGNKVFGSDSNGIWLGAADFPTAPFRVNMEGNVVATSADFSGSGYTKVNTFKQASIPTSVAIGDLWVDTDDSNKLYRAAAVGATTIATGQWELSNDLRAADAILKAGSGQTLTGDILVGEGGVKIDGANKAIVITDGTEKVRLGKQADNSYGLLINDGKITVKNSDSSTIIDSQGLVSGINFNKNITEFNFSSAEATDSTTWVDVPYYADTVHINLQVYKDTNVLIYGYIKAFNTALLYWCDFRIMEGWYNWETSSYTWVEVSNTRVYGSLYDIGVTPERDIETVSYMDAQTLVYHDQGANPPTHQIKVQWKVGGGTGYCYYVKLGYVRLG